MDFATKEIFKRYASIMVGRPISPVFLNILVTSVCDMPASRIKLLFLFDIEILDASFSLHDVLFLSGTHGISCRILQLLLLS